MQGNPMHENLSQKEQGELLKKIRAIKAFIEAAPKDENVVRLLDAARDIEREIAGKRYGLVFEEHKEPIEAELEKHEPTLIEDEALFIDNSKGGAGKGGRCNLIIEGDNLAVLTALKKTRAGKVDIIYIDPPYNTGRALVYTDRQAAEGDAFRHSKWLSFMQKRLVIARELLCNAGLAMISIDDREQAALKLLCDAIFGEANFLGTLIHQRAKGGGQARHIVKGHDYIHVYAKNARDAHLSVKKKMPAKDAVVSIGGKLYAKNDDVLRKSFGRYAKGQDRRCAYEEILHYKGEKKKAQVDARLAAGEYFLEERDGRHIVCRLESVDGARAKVYSIIKALSEEGKADLDALGISGFSYPKPLSLMETLCDINNKKDSVILDFFAGSGTTGHAVMRLNAQDGGSRSFILCNSSEGDICRSVTYERIRRAIEREGFAESARYFRVKA